jgi:TonB family protein
VTILMLLAKVSALFALALLCLPLMRRPVFATTAALRHLICAAALSGALLFVLTLAFEPKAIPVQVPVVFVATVATVAKAGPRTFSVASLLFGLWAAGALALLLRLAVGYRRISTVVRNAERTSENPPVFLADVSVPIVCGLFRTAILLPRDSAEWPPEQRAAALRHELAHLERKDLWTSLIANIACAVYWVHPLAWAVARRLREEQEDACDDAVLAGGFEPATYAEALIATAQNLTSPSLIGCHMLTGQSLKNRITRLLDLNLPRSASGPARARIALVSVSALALIGLIYAQPPVIELRTEVRKRVPPPEAPATEEKVFRVGQDAVRPPTVLRKIDPEYTEEARAAKIAGSVLLSIVVGADGLAHDINVLSTPDQGLGMKAVEAVQQWKFNPGMKDGEPVAVKASVEVNFRLL